VYRFYGKINTFYSVMCTTSSSETVWACIGSHRTHWRLWRDGCYRSNGSHWGPGRRWASRTNWIHRGKQLGERRSGCDGWQRKSRWWWARWSSRTTRTDRWKGTSRFRRRKLRRCSIRTLSLPRWRWDPQTFTFNNHDDNNNNHHASNTGWKKTDGMGRDFPRHVCWVPHRQHGSHIVCSSWQRSAFLKTSTPLTLISSSLLTKLLSFVIIINYGCNGGSV